MGELLDNKSGVSEIMLRGLENGGGWGVGGGVVLGQTGENTT